MQAADIQASEVRIEGEVYLTATEVCRRLGLARQTLWRWRQAGHVPVGRRFRVRLVVFTPGEFQQIEQYANKLEPAVVRTDAKSVKKGKHAQ